MIEKYYAGETTAREEQELHQTLLEKEEVGDFDTELALFQLMDQNRREEPSEEFDFKLNEELSKLSKGSRVRKLRRLSLIGVAASLLLLLFVYPDLWEGGDSPELQISTTSETKNIELPDGSLVWLNKNSVLKYPETFAGNDRVVTLEGEGFFEVVHDLDRPFMVQAGQTSTRVLGTSFNIRNYLKENIVEVAVASGKVSFTSKSDGKEKAISLEENEVGSYSKSEDSIVKGQLENRSLFAWKTGESGQKGTQLLIEAFEKSEDNYSTSPHVLNGFFRETLVEDSKAVHLLEAAVDIHDPGFRLVDLAGGLPDEVVFLRQIRTSNNYSRKELRPNLEQFNSLAGVLKWNRAKYLDPQLPERLEVNEYQLDSIAYLEGSRVYVISYYQDNQELTYSDTYYVDMKTLAIKKYEKKSIAKPGFYLDNQFSLAGDTTYLFSLKEDRTNYEFEEIDGKMYLKFGSGQGKADILNAETGEVEWELGINRILVINGMEEAELKEDEIPMNPEVSLGLQTTKYDSDFWDTYDLLGLFPLNDKVERDLEWELPLGTQFEGLDEVSGQ